MTLGCSQQSNTYNNRFIVAYDKTYVDFRERSNDISQRINDNWGKTQWL